MLYFIIGFLFLLIGIALGVFGTNWVLKRRVFGEIKTKIDDTTNEWYLYLDLDRHPASMGYYKYVVFKTDLPKPQAPRE